MGCLPSAIVNLFAFFWQWFTKKPETKKQASIRILVSSVLISFFIIMIITFLSDDEMRNDNSVIAVLIIFCVCFIIPLSIRLISDILYLNMHSFKNGIATTAQSNEHEIQKLFSSPITQSSNDYPAYLQQNRYAFHKTKGLVKIYAIDDSIHFIDKQNEKYFTKIEKISNFSQPFQVGDIVDHRLFGEVKITNVTNTTVTVTHKNNPPRTFAINDFAENVIQLTKSKISLDDKPEQKNQNKKEINTMEKLTASRWKQLGTNSRTIYLDCCEKYGWKKELANNFGRQGSLQFARNATNEDYDVWALTHSNLNDSNAIRWTNKITEDLLTVTQYNTIEGEENNTENETRKNLRIVFAKTRLSTGEGYAFLGVYKFVERIPLYNNPDYVAKYVYKQVSKVYPFKNDVVIPSWLKVGEKVKHSMLGQVTITDLDERNNAISIEDENGKKHNLNLENCIEKNVFSPIEVTPPCDLPSFVKVGNKVKHVNYGIVEILSLSEEYIFIQDSNKRGYYVRKEKAHELLKPIHKPPFTLTPGTTIRHKELGRAWITNVTETTITVIDKKGTPHTLNLDFCYERNLLSEDKD